MKHNAFAAAFLTLALFALLAGCANSRSASPVDAVAPPPLQTQPLETQSEASDASAAMALEDDAWLENDWGWDEDGAADFYVVPDPLEKFNRVMFVFNDKLYFWVLKPVAQGYRFVVPRPARSGIRNFFHNLGAPVRIVNNILQGKGQAAEAEVAKFLYNSTVGVLGFGNPARTIEGLNPDRTDLGITLGRYGIGNGFYLVWPVLGPSTLRDSVGNFGDSWLKPTMYLDPSEVFLALAGLDIINATSFRIGDYESLKSAALDPYQSLRDGYIQLRQSKLK